MSLSAGVSAQRGLRGSAALSVLALGLLTGCDAKQATQFATRVKVESDPGQPVAQAKLLRDGETLAATGADGTANLALLGAPGERVTLQVLCPSGYRAPDKALSIVLRPLLESRTPEYRVRCPPLLRSVVVAVRAQHGPNLPVKYLGRELARTDASGACHALLKLGAGETATLTLDTSAPEHAGLIPRNPELKITVPERDELLVFDQSFRRELEKPKKRAGRVATGPTRI